MLGCRKRFLINYEFRCQKIWLTLFGVDEQSDAHSDEFLETLEHVA